MENNYNNMIMVKKYRLPTQQMLIENNITTECEVAKILAVDSCVSTSPDITINNNEAQISGKLMLNILYVDTEGNVNGENHISPFTYKLKDEKIENGVKLVVNTYVMDNDVASKGGNDLKVVANVNFDVTLIKNCERKYLANCGDDTYTKLAEVTNLAYTKDCCERFEEDLEATVKGTSLKVLNTSVELEVKDVNTGTNFAVVEGELFARILYVDGNEANELQTIVINKQFKQEFEVEGVNKETTLDLMPYLIYDEIAVTLNEKEEGEEFCVKVPMLMCFNFYEKTSTMNIVDMYSSKELIEVSREDFSGDNLNAPFVVEGKIEGSVIISDENPRVDKYFCTTNVHAMSTNAYVKDNTIYIEGITTANVIYLNDETDGLQAVQIEIPFVISNQTDLADNVNLGLKLCLENVDVMVKRGREIFFDAKLKALVLASEEYTYSAITKVDAIGEVAPKDASLEIYFGKNGESIWDIAKNLKIPSELILNQNPNLADPLEKDENIAIYYQRTNN